MKRVLTIVFLAALLSPAWATPLRQGRYELRTDAIYDIDNTDDDAHATVQAGFGYYFADDLLAGVSASFVKKPWNSYWGVDDIWGIGVFGEYNFSIDDVFVPYVGGSAAFLDGDESQDTVFVLGVSGGVKIFLTDFVALSAQLNAEWGSDEIYDYDRDNAEEGDGNEFDVIGALGLRLYFY